MAYSDKHREYMRKWSASFKGKKCLCGNQAVANRCGPVCQRCLDLEKDYYQSLQGGKGNIRNERTTITVN